MVRIAQSLPLVTGLLLSLLFALLIHFAPLPGIAQIRETVFDALIQLRPRPAAPEVVVVDIDERSDGSGDDAWSRTKTAAMVEQLAAAGAAVVAFDLVFSAFCEPDVPGNAELAAALAKLPVVLGFLLNDRNEGSPAPLPPIAIKQPIAAPDLWFAASAEKSCVAFESAAVGTGVASLAGDGDARIRLTPAVVVVADAPYPGLALEALRVGKALAGADLWRRSADLPAGLVQHPRRQRRQHQAAAHGQRGLGEPHDLRGRRAGGNRECAARERDRLRRQQPAGDGRAPRDGDESARTVGPDPRRHRDRVARGHRAVPRQPRAVARGARRGTCRRAGDHPRAAVAAGDRVPDRSGFCDRLGRCRRRSSTGRPPTCSIRSIPRRRCSSSMR